MDNNISNHNAELYDEEIDIKELIGKVWYKRRFIIKCTAVFLVLGLFIAFTSPVSYTSQITLVPQSGGQKGGSLGGLASMMGVNLGSTTTGEVLSPTVYPQIIKSVPFCKDIMNTFIVVKKSNGESITLYEYYTDKKYQSTNIMGAVKKYTIGLPGLLLSAVRSSDTDEAYLLSEDSLKNAMFAITEDERKVIEAIRGGTTFNSNDKDGYITLAYSFPEPEAAAAITQSLFDTLEQYVINYKSQKQQDNLEFVEESYMRAKNDFMEKQANLASFQDANRNLATATAQATQRRLSAEYEVAYTVYNELAKQLEQAKISVKESAPVLTIIDPVVIPHEKSAPRRGFILFVFVLLGFVFSIGWIFTKPFYQDIKSTVTEYEKEEPNI